MKKTEKELYFISRDIAGLIFSILKKKTNGLSKIDTLKTAGFAISVITAELVDNLIDGELKCKLEAIEALISASSDFLVEIEKHKNSKEH